jgi:hypothetical protein
MLGFVVLMKKQVLNAKANWAILAIWLVSIIILSFTIPPYIRNFQEDGRYTSVNRYNMYDKTAVFNFNDIGEDEFDLVSLRIRSYEDTVIKLEQEFLATGSSRQEAIENAKMIKYGFAVNDSIFTFNSNLDFEENAKYRRQQLEMTLYLPYGQKFTLEENMKYLLGSFMYREGFSNNMMNGNVFAFDEDGLNCITCVDTEMREDREDVSWNISGYKREFDIDDFSELEINSAFRVNLKESDEYTLIVSGRRTDVDKVVIEKEGHVLSMDYKGDVMKLNRQRNEINVYISMPELSSLQLASASKVYATGFDEDYMDIELNGAAFADLHVEVNSIKANVEGASKLLLSGSGQRLSAKISGASTLQSYDFIVDDTEVETHSASTARVFANDHLTIRSHGASNVTYRGGADVDIEKSGSSSIRKE